MAIFKPIQENQATGKVKEIYDDIKDKRQITEVKFLEKFSKQS